ncbi:hypothetical protein ACJRO7_000791 [Eucalyptus globulus]|uniref:DhaK domain-containing protein n=1 Tax=Eucalyptus globulus TaxID=34317 RepID=A0ABD3LSY1_EUCGL
MESCAGAGSLLACVVKEGIDSIEVGCLKELLELLRRYYSNPQPPSTYLGGMLGIVNSLGAEAGLVLIHPLSSNYGRYRLKESSHIMRALLSSPVCEPLLTSSMQEMFLVAQHSEDNQLQQYSAWALSFLRHSLWSKEVNSDDHIQTDTTVSEVASQSFSNDNTWNVLVEVVATLQRAEGSIKRQWLVYAVEISYVSNFPSTGIRAVTGPMGCLLIVKNYTGDRLNFGLAAELAKSEGYVVEMVIVRDDCALPPPRGIVGRRGLAGTILVHKVARAAAAAGLSLKDVAAEAKRASEMVGTMGVAVSVCTLPGQAFHAYDSRLLGKLHVALLKSIIRDIEDVARTPTTGLGVNQNNAGNPEGGHPQIVEGHTEKRQLLYGRQLEDFWDRGNRQASR